MGVCESECNEKSEKENKKTNESKDYKNNQNFIKLFLDKNIFKYRYNNKIGIGFFCLIPFPQKNIQVMVINDLIIEENDIIQKKKLYLILYKNEQPLEVQLHSDIFLYSNKKYNFTIIENQNNVNYYYLQIDEHLMEDNLNDIYRHKKIDLIFISDDDLYYHKIGKIEKINDDNTIVYISETLSYKIGLIKICSTNKLIGIIKDNSGFLLKEALIELNSNFKYNKNNKIKNNDNYFNRTKEIKDYNINENEEIIKRSLTQYQSKKNNIKYKIKEEQIKENSLRINYTPLNNNFKLKEKSLHNNSSYIKSLLISLYQILYIRKYLANEINNILKNKNFEISNLICQYFNYFSVNNFQLCEKIISDLENKINDSNKSILITISFEKFLELILSHMHSELNKKQTINNDLKKEDYDENIAFNYFRKKYQDQNYSEIQEIFFGIKERIDNYNCCKLKKYSFEIFKYINFNIDQTLNAKNSNNLQNLISELETKENPDSKFCSMCYKDSEILTQQKLKKCPKILIITINNSNKKELQINSIIRTEKYEYKLICCIAESQIENDFNIIYYLKNSWNIIKEKDNNTGKEIGNEIGSLILYPCVLFFEKVDKKIAINDKNSNVSSIQSNFDNINPDIMSNSIYSNITNNLNINSNINNNNGKSFNNNVHKINIYNTKKSSKKLYQEKVNGRGDKNINKKIKRKYQKNKKYYNNIYDNKAINIMINKLNTNYFNNKINNNNQKKIYIIIPIMKLLRQII